MFIAESHQNKNGKNKGKSTIWFNGRKSNKATGTVTEHCKPQFTKYIAENFNRLVDDLEEMRTNQAVYRSGRTSRF